MLAALDAFPCLTLCSLPVLDNAPRQPADTWTRLSPSRAIAALVADWGLIVAAFAGALLFANATVYLLAAILIARTQLALAILMHESAHGLLFQRRRVNDFVGQAFAAAPLMLSLYSYQRGHLKHHRAPMAPDDPVATVFSIGDYPISRSQLAFRLALDLSGVGYFVSVVRFLSGGRRLLPGGAAVKTRRPFVLSSILVANGILLGSLWLAGHAGAYVGLWILPALTLLPFFGRMRAIMEHAGYGYSADQRLNARTIVRPNWQTFFFGPHAIHYHIEHHAYVQVPFYNLRAVHRAMAAEGLLPLANLHRDYGSVLRDVTTLARGE